MYMFLYVYDFLVKQKKLYDAKIICMTIIVNIKYKIMVMLYI